MKIRETSIQGLLILEPEVFEDDRGFFMEIHQQKKYVEEGIDRAFVQDNLSYSVRGTLRGLHYQYPHAQAKLVQAISGEIFDVVVDIRRDSPTFGKWAPVLLSEKNRRQVFVPEGFAHGFYVMSDAARVLYKCTDFYVPEAEHGILWSDPDLAIDWPGREPLLSPKDSRYPNLGQIPAENLPSYRPTKLHAHSRNRQ